MCVCVTVRACTYTSIEALSAGILCGKYKAHELAQVLGAVFSRHDPAVVTLQPGSTVPGISASVVGVPVPGVRNPSGWAQPGRRSRADLAKHGGDWGEICFPFSSPAPLGKSNFVIMMEPSQN